MIIETERLYIRELSNDDVAVVFELYSDKEAMKFRGSKSFENIEEASIMIKSVIENSKTKTEFRYGIIEKSSNDLIGTFLITPVSKTICKIGCSFGKKYWRLGYGFEIMSIMINYLQNLHYEVIIGLIKKENFPSIKLVEKMKFKFIEQTENPEFYQYEFNTKLHELDKRVLESKKSGVDAFEFLDSLKSKYKL
ncbi:GNAT family N-acetyltransferase [Flavobacterium sp.]|uniref:GNAT family N-acetyltransferase n=1 Tax=Flavobacterium sp. TaxID=239 RepID=UPI0037517B70